MGAVHASPSQTQDTSNARLPPTGMLLTRHEDDNKHCGEIEEPTGVVPGPVLRVVPMCNGVGGGWEGD